MKMTDSDYQYIKGKIGQLFETDPNIVSRYENGQFVNADRCKDLQMRFCFDMMHLAGLTHYVCDNLYSYLNDDHIYTALRSVCPTITKKY